MPKNQTIKTVLVIGSGPIIISQGCEFDYSGTQACLALKEEGCKVILINPNPASIMTDPDIADVTYIEPLDPQFVEKIFIKEKPDSILPTMGGQTAINLILELYKLKLLEKYNVSIIGVTIDTILKTENRIMFNELLLNLRIDHAKFKIIYTIDDINTLSAFSYPYLVRTSFTLGGGGSGIANNEKELKRLCRHAFNTMPQHPLIIEEAFYGWKEFELEVMRDNIGNFIVVCSIENLDPLGIHTGDSITVAPALTLTDQEYQNLRNIAIAIMDGIGMSSGGCNIQFAIEPKSGRTIVIEVNPRVSRSSALASKATGFPIARCAAKTALGYNLNEISHALTKNQLPASFEPSIDYVVVKIPCFNFYKFNGVNTDLSTQMKSVGETMGIGRSFQEALQKALRGAELNITDLSDFSLLDEGAEEVIIDSLVRPSWIRILYVAEAFRRKWTIERVYGLTKIDRWFLHQISEIITMEEKLKLLKFPQLTSEYLLQLKSTGFSDKRIAEILHVAISDIRQLRQQTNIKPVYKRIDSCAGEFSTETSYLYSTYERSCESLPSSNKKVVILGSGPNRIGQGIEFDYCCVHAAMAAKGLGYETIMINNNPETVSTDYNISDKLYFEPLTSEDVGEILSLENPEGVLIQFGGQTPLLLAKDLIAAGCKILGTQYDAICVTENRKLFSQFINDLKIPQPKHITFTTKEEAELGSHVIRYPCILRPSYVLGGDRLRIINDQIDLDRYLSQLPAIHEPILLEEFMEDAVEIDVDLICDGEDVLLCGILEQFEPAGIHAGDSSCILPPINMSETILTTIIKYSKQIALNLKIVGAFNIQYIVKDNIVYVLEANARASRTMPFVSKAAGLSLIKIATKSILGISLKEQGYTGTLSFNTFNIKKPIFSFNKFPELQPILGPSMQATGEMMLRGKTKAEVYSKFYLINNTYEENIKQNLYTDVDIYPLQEINDGY